MPQPPADLTVLTTVLAWLAAGGSMYVAGVTFSYLADNWPKWSTLPSAAKKISPLLLGVVLAVASTVLLQYQDVIAIVQPWWAVVVQSLIVYAASQATFYRSVKPLQLQQKDPSSNG